MNLSALHTYLMHTLCVRCVVERLQTELDIAEKTVASFRNQLDNAAKTVASFRNQYIVARDKEKYMTNKAGLTHRTVITGLGKLMMFLILHVPLDSLRPLMRSLVQQKRVEKMLDEFDFTTTQEMVNPGLRYFRLAFEEYKNGTRHNELAVTLNRRLDFCAQAMKLSLTPLARYMEFHKGTCVASKDLTPNHIMYNIVEAGVHLHEHTEDNFYPTQGWYCFSSS